MISEDHLIGWLVMIRLSYDAEREPWVPRVVQDELGRLGWLEFSSGARGARHATITDEGLKVTDLEGPEWGVDGTFVLEES